MKQNLFLFLLLIFFSIKLSRAQSQQLQIVNNLAARAVPNFKVELVFHIPNDTQRARDSAKATVYYGTSKEDLERAKSHTESTTKTPGQMFNITIPVTNSKNELFYFGVKYSISNLTSNMSNIVQLTPSESSGKKTHSVLFVLVFVLGFTFII